MQVVVVLLILWNKHIWKSDKSLFTVRDQRADKNDGRLSFYNVLKCVCFVRAFWHFSTIQFYECANTLETESISKRYGGKKSRTVEIHSAKWWKRKTWDTHIYTLHTIKLLRKTNACTTPYHLVPHYLFSSIYFFL